MVAIALGAAPNETEVSGLTAGFGENLITNEAALAVAALAVESLVDATDSRSYDAIIIAAFGDPGLTALQHRGVPAVGIAQAGMLEAGADERPFVVVTTTPDLVRTIAAAATRYGIDRAYRGTRITPGDPALVMGDPDQLTDALAEASQIAIEYDGAEAILVGGGPLAIAACALVGRGFPVPIIQPIPAAVRRALRLIASAN